MDDRLAAEVERALSRDRPIRREHDCLTILENFETTFLSRAIEHETESHPIDQENEHSGENVELAAVEVEPEEAKTAGLQYNVRCEEDLVPALAKAAERGEVE